MDRYDERIQELQEKCARLQWLSEVLDELREKRRTLDARVLERKAALREEQEDVERLEGRTLTALLSGLTGTREERLEQERQEAANARAKLAAVQRELAAVEDEICRHEDERRALRDCGERYQEALREKADAIRAAGGTAAVGLQRLEESACALKDHGRELREAVSAGSAALSTAQQVLDELKTAKGWGTWDLVGGGVITDAVKHSHLDEAQRGMERLQSQLRRFKTELADVSVRADMQVGVDGVLRFADFFFDGVFADWAVLDRIGQSQDQVSAVCGQIESALFRLRSLLSRVEGEQRRLTDEREALIRNTRLS